MAENNHESLRSQFTKSFDIKIDLCELEQLERNGTIDEIIRSLKKYSLNCNIQDVTNSTFNVTIPYNDGRSNYVNFAPLIRVLEGLQQQQRIVNFRVFSKNLEGIFSNLVSTTEPPNSSSVVDVAIGVNGANKNDVNKIEVHHERAADKVTNQLSEWAVIKNLFWKRFMHFRRNYRLIVCVLVMPTLFATIAMGFLKIRPPGDYENSLTFSKQLYANSTEFYRLVEI